MDITRFDSFDFGCFAFWPAVFGERDVAFGVGGRFLPLNCVGVVEGGQTL